MQSEPTPEHRKMLAVPGHPGIYRKGKRYLVRWRHQGRMKARSFRTLSEAARFKASTVAGDTQPSSREIFHRYAARWLDTYSGRTAKGLSGSTLASYKDTMHRVIVPYFGRSRLDQIDAPMIREFVGYLAGTGLAAGTVRRYVAVLRACLATAYEDGQIRANPSVRVVVPGERKRKPKRLTPGQTRTLLASMPAEHADLTYVLASTGLRISEALSLVWSDFLHDDDGRPVLVVRRSKTAAGERTVPLSAGAAQRLVKGRGDAPADQPIFPSEFGTPLDAHNFRNRVFRPAAKRAGVPWATPHTLRHGIASLMAERGYSPAQIAAHLGHADGGVLALRTYVHADAHEAPDFIDGTLAEAQFEGPRIAAGIAPAVHPRVHPNAETAQK